MKKSVLYGILAVAGLGFVSSAQAFEFRVRWVTRVGTVDTPLGVGNATLNLMGADPAATRIRIQFGVFDDATGAAPAGGFVGWNVGTLTSAGQTNTVLTRTPGRLAPFNFAGQPTANGDPAADPWNDLTMIDATLGTQAPFWNGCDAEGNPVPPPPPTIRGLNTFVSVYEITLDPNVGWTNFSITLGGNMIAATEWRIIGTPNPPDCSDPDNPIPGMIQYAPFPTPPLPISGRLDIVPAPGALALLGLGGLIAGRRRRA